MPLASNAKFWLAALICLIAANLAIDNVAAQEPASATKSAEVSPNEKNNSQEPSQEEFAKLVIKALAKTSEVPFVYDAENFRLVRQSKDKADINLANVYKEYLALEDAERPAHVARIAAAFSLKETDLPTDFDSIKQNLMPKIWSRATFENMKLRQRINAGAVFDITLRPMGEHLLTSLVYDTEEAMRTVSNPEIKTWGVNYDRAFKVACKNLAASTEAYSQLGDHLHSSVSGDNYDSARILLDYFKDAKVKGDKVAVVANRNSVYVAGSEDPESLKMMFDLSAMGAEDARPLSPLPLVLKDGKWTDWVPPKDHVSRAVYDQRSVQFFNTLYSQQKKLLDQVFKVEGKDIFVASFTAVTNQQAKVTSSFCVWANGVDSLLPKTQIVVLCAKQGEMTANGEWEHVQKIVGDLMEVDDSVYPTRYRVKGFPTAEQLEAIGKIEL